MNIWLAILIIVVIVVLVAGLRQEPMATHTAEVVAEAVVVV